MIDTIIEALNKIILPNNGKIILHKELKRHKKFPIYKEYIYNLYLLNTSYTLIYKFSHQLNTTDISKGWTTCDNLFLPYLLRYITSDSFKKLIKNA